ncbi:hypothetical protein L559_2611 [Bordetella pertussis STO1-CHOC-0017]|nr:hypothetical protein L559_2611 [Bordetella pertussis STO1-CHOC-0017]
MPAAAACFPGGETSGVFRLGGANHWRRSSWPAPVAQAGAAHIAPEPASAASRQRQLSRPNPPARRAANASNGAQKPERDARAGRRARDAIFDG